MSSSCAVASRTSGMWGPSTDIIIRWRMSLAVSRQRVSKDAIESGSLYRCRSYRQQEQSSENIWEHLRTWDTFYCTAMTWQWLSCALQKTDHHVASEWTPILSAFLNALRILAMILKSGVGILCWRTLCKLHRLLTSSVNLISRLVITCFMEWFAVTLSLSFTGVMFIPAPSTLTVQLLHHFQQIPDWSL